MLSKEQIHPYYGIVLEQLAKLVNPVPCKHTPKIEMANYIVASRNRNIASLSVEITTDEDGNIYFACMDSEGKKMRTDDPLRVVLKFIDEMDRSFSQKTRREMIEAGLIEDDFDTSI